MRKELALAIAFSLIGIGLAGKPPGAGDTESEKQELHRQWGVATDAALGACRSVLKGYLLKSNWADYKRYRAESIQIDSQTLQSPEHRSGWEVSKGFAACDVAIPKAFEAGDCEHAQCILKHEDAIEIGPDSKTPAN